MSITVTFWEIILIFVLVVIYTILRSAITMIHAKKQGQIVTQAMQAINQNCENKTKKNKT